jgi:molybdate transport system ATP-binding protein
VSVTLRDVTLPLDEFSLEIDAVLPARTTALCGPSGAGKTSVLEVIAGLRTPRSGAVNIAGRTVFDSQHDIDLPPRLRRAGYVPQDDALFPHLSAGANMLYGARDTAGPFSIEHVEQVLEIGALRKRDVQRLSGGERKRIALARALLSRPEILLLDEPLAGVHTALRGRVLEYLVRVRDEFAIPMIYVTHDVGEASAVCDEIVVIDRGKIRERSSALRPRDIRN